MRNPVHTYRMCRKRMYQHVSMHPRLWWMLRLPSTGQVLCKYFLYGVPLLRPGAWW